MATWRGALRIDPAVGGPSLVNFASASPALANGGCRDLDIAPDGTIWFALIGYGGTQGGVVRHTPGTSDWHYWTGGSVPAGGQRLAAAGLERGARLDPAQAGRRLHRLGRQRQQLRDRVLRQRHAALDLPRVLLHARERCSSCRAKDCVDDAGNLWARRFVAFSGSDAGLLARLPHARRHLGRCRRSRPCRRTPADLGLPRLRRRRGAARRRQRPDLALQRHRLAGPRHLAATAATPTTWTSTALGNVWACGIGGAAKRDAATGLWQRYRVTQHQPVRLLQRRPARRSGDGPRLRLRQRRTRRRRHDDVRRHALDRLQQRSVRARRALALPDRQLPSGRASGPRTAAWPSNPTYNGLHEWNGATWTDLERHEREPRARRGLAGPPVVAGQLLRPALPQRDELDPRCRTTAPGATTSSATRPGRGRSGRAPTPR